MSFKQLVDDACSERFPFMYEYTQVLPPKVYHFHIKMYLSQGAQTTFVLAFHLKEN